MQAGTFLAQDPDARLLLEIFSRFGRDGRAIPVSSLMRHTGFGTNKGRLAAAIGQLLAVGAIKPAGFDPLATEAAYRLAAPVARIMAEGMSMAL